jgi:CHAT domain-containing protein
MSQRWILYGFGRAAICYVQLLVLLLVNSCVVSISGQVGHSDSRDTANVGMGKTPFQSDSLYIALRLADAQRGYEENVLDSVMQQTTQIIGRIDTLLRDNHQSYTEKQMHWLVASQVSGLFLQSNVMYDKGYPDSALVPILRAIRIAEQQQAQLFASLVSLYSRASNIYLITGEYSTASSYAEQALRVVRVQFPNDSSKWIRPLMARNNIFSQRNQHREAITGYRSMLEICKDTSQCTPYTHYSIKYNLANSFYRYNDFWAALPIYQEVIDYCTSAGRKSYPLLAIAQYSLAGCYGTIGMFDQALNAMRQSIHYYRLINPEDNIDLADCYGDIAILYDQVGQHELALQYAKQSLQLRKRMLGTMKHPSIVQSLKTIGDIYENLGDVNDKIDYFRSSLAYSDSILAIIEQDTQWSGLPKAIYLRDKATILHKLGETKSNEFLLRSLVHQARLRTSIQHKSKQWGAIVTDYALHFMRIGDLDSALYWAHQAQEAFCPTDLVLQKHQAPRTLRTSFYPMLLSCLETKIQTLALIKPEAVPAIGQYGHRLIDSLRQSKSSNEDLIRLAYSSNLFYQTYIAYSSRQLPFNQLIAVQMQDSLLERVHYFMEQNKGFIARKSVSSGAALQSLPPKVAERTKELALAQGYYQRLIDDELANCPDCNQGLIDSIYLIKVELDKQSHRLKDTLRELFPDYYALRHDPKHYTLSAVNSYLKAQKQPSAIVSYSLLDTILTIYVHTTTKTWLYRKILHPHLGNKSQLVLQIDSLQQLFGTIKGSLNNPDQLYRLSYAVFQQVLAPILPVIKGHQLIIIPDGVLHHLPFELLCTAPVESSTKLNAGGTPPYLIHDYAISYHYSINLLIAQQQRKTEPKLEFLGIAPVFADNSQTAPLLSMLREADQTPPTPLSQSMAEVASIAAIFQQRNLISTTWLHQQANKARWMSDTSLANYRYIHLATHAVGNTTQPNASNILLYPSEYSSHTPYQTEDWRIYSHDLFRIKLSADLVCLSACESGSGKQVSGEGVIGLTQGFFFAGARNMIVSKWKVDDAAAASFMRYFYQSVLEGHTYAQSLQNAKLQLMQIPTYRSPFFWASFVLLGK